MCYIILCHVIFYYILLYLNIYYYILLYLMIFYYLYTHQISFRNHSEIRSEIIGIESKIRMFRIKCQDVMSSFIGRSSSHRTVEHTWKSSNDHGFQPPKWWLPWHEVNQIWSQEIPAEFLLNFQMLNQQSNLWGCVCMFLFKQDKQVCFF